MVRIIKKIIWAGVIIWVLLFLYRNFIARDIEPFFEKYKDTVAF